MARIDVRPAPVVLTPMADAIANRRTNRGPYRPEPLDPGLLAELAAADDLTATVRWVVEPAARQALGELLVDAAQAVADDDAMSRDGYTWFRSSESAIEAHRDGLTVDGQGLAAPVRAVARLVPSLASRSMADSAWVKQTKNVHTKTASAYGVVLVEDPYARADQLAGGRLAQRVHLTATVEGVALQHMNQITERIDRDRAGGHSAGTAARLAKILGADAGRVLCLFRVGWPTRPGQASPRRAAHQVVVRET
jgi:hypothetical protein